MIAAGPGDGGDELSGPGEPAAGGLVGELGGAGAPARAPARGPRRAGAHRGLEPDRHHVAFGRRRDCSNDAVGRPPPPQEEKRPSPSPSSSTPSTSRASEERDDDDDGEEQERRRGRAPATAAPPPLGRIKSSTVTPPHPGPFGARTHAHTCVYILYVH